MINRFLDKFNLKIETKKNKFDLIIKKLIKKDNPLILDIGANIGQSIDRFKLLYKNPKIICFEPEENCYAILKKKYFFYKNIKLFNIALGDKKIKKKFNIFSNSVHSSFLKPDFESKWFNIRNNKFNKKFLSNSILLETNTLDHFFKKLKLKNIDIMKIDVQGFEDKVLLGSKKSLNKIKLIEVEIILGNRYSCRSSFYQIEKSLDNKFTLFAIDRHGDLLNNPSLALNCIYINNKFLGQKS